MFPERRTVSLHVRVAFRTVVDRVVRGIALFMSFCGWAAFSQKCLFFVGAANSFSFLLFTL